MLLATSLNYLSVCEFGMVDGSDYHNSIVHGCYGEEASQNGKSEQ